jgi:two-component system sensor histidine kinase QseC
MITAQTLTGRLLAWALGALVVVWASFVAVGLRTGEHEADELTDGHLASVAALMLSLEGDNRFVPGSGVAAGGDAAPLPELKSHDYQQSMSVVLWDAAGRVLTHRGAAPMPPFNAAEGFETLELDGASPRWRSFSRWDPARTRKVMVLLNLQERDELAWDIAEQVAEPGLWLLPVVALALGLAIRRGLRPLYDLSSEVHALDIHQLDRMAPKPRHAEFRAVVASINTLVDRYQAAMTRERQLASELAHELRTPLASLSLQARSLREASAAAERSGAPPHIARDALQRIEGDALRAGKVLTQLLALARASRTELAEAAQALDLAELARGVVAEYAQTALDSGHELALTGSERFALRGHPVLLEVALRNLIENALGHTPSGTAIEVQLDAAQSWLQVCDDGGGGSSGGGSGGGDGTGAPPAGAPVQGLGLGLGHRVVEKIAALHNATFARVDAGGCSGSCYRLAFAPR